MASKYLGRRIVIVFLRDVTAVNKTMREVRGEREKFKNVFERGLLPAFILNHKGYINVMNKAARDLFTSAKMTAIFTAMSISARADAGRAPQAAPRRKRAYGLCV